MHIGFTGTQEGMTVAQFSSLEEFMEDNPHFSVAHHGDCIGADAEFHTLCIENRLWIVGHPPINESKRAFCPFDEIREPKEYLDRNKDIVDEARFMIVAPKGPEELRSGTWSTARYAKKKNIHGLIFWPDGTIEDLIKEG